MTFTHLDLFAGIGGFSLAVEWLGGNTVAFVEWEAWNRRVLYKHWPEAQFYGDIRTVTNEHLRELGRIDLITGGYPCQPFSLAGQRRGHDDPRHLWPEMRRVIDATRPRFVLAENVAGHISMGLDAVLADLEADGYTAGAVVVPAGAVNALHRRDRVWIMAHRDGEHAPERGQRADAAARTSACSGRNTGVADTKGRVERLPGDEALPLGEGRRPRVEHQRGGAGLHQRPTEPGMADAGCRDGERWTCATGGHVSHGHHAGREEGPGGLDERGEGVPHPIGQRQPGPGPRQHASDQAPDREGQAGDVEHGGPAGDGAEVARALDAGHHGLSPGLVRRPATGPAEPDLIRQAWADGSWEADLPRVVSDEPERRQKLMAAGNAIVPLVAYEILRVMLEATT